jgi:23S rRNA (adenine2503-C2)-methyltransferase
MREEPHSVYDLDLQTLHALLESLGEPSFRARQVWKWLYVHLADSYDSMTNIPQSVRESLTSSNPIQTYERINSVSSSDGQTKKDLLLMSDGEAVEVVLMRYERRRTACLSTQVGCPVGCTFCATGQGGFQRNLSTGEIVAQAIHLERQLRGEGSRMTNLVLMGMGEPLLNYENTVAAVRRLSEPDGFSLGQRHITLSTVGILPGIERLAGEGLQITLAISLHAATDQLRDKLVPVNRSYPLEMLFDACRRYSSAAGRRITFEWALIAGVNDSERQAQELVTWLTRSDWAPSPIPHVNLIPLNPTAGYKGQESSTKAICAFRDVLQDHGIPHTVRLRRGIEIQAGCGQLRQQMEIETCRLEQN